MKKLSLVCTGLAAAVVLAVGASPAQAKSSWFFGVNTAPAYPAYYAPGYYYYAPPPPPPVYYPYYYPGYYGCYRPSPVNFSFGYYRRR